MKVFISFLIFILFTFSVNAELLNSNEDMIGHTYGIAQDKKGVMYFATQNGAFLYDGQNNLALSEVYDIPNAWVRDLRYYEKTNVLIVGFESFGVYQVNLTDGSVLKVSSDNSYVISLSIQEGILVLRLQDRMEFYRLKDNTQLNLLLTNPKIKSSTDGYIDTDTGLYQFSKNQYTLIDAYISKRSKLINSTNGLVAWRDGKLNYFDKSNRSISVDWPTVPKTMYVYENTLYIERNGDILTLSLFDLKAVEGAIKTDLQRIRRVFIDSHSNLWVVSTNEISIFKNNIEHNSLQKKSENNRMIKHGDTTFLSTDDGVFIKTNESYRKINQSTDIGNIINDLGFINSNLVIASNTGAYLYNLETQKIKKIYSGWVIGVHQIDDDIYLATDTNGVYIVEAQKAKPVPYINIALRSNEILGIKKIDNLIYVLTGKGFLIVDNKTATVHATNLYKVIDIIKFKGDLYLATFGTGLYKQVNETFEQMPGPTHIIDIVQHEQNLVISTSSGIYKYAESFSVIPGTSKLNVTPNSVHLKGSLLRFGTQLGISTIDLDFIENKIFPVVNYFKLGERVEVNYPLEVDLNVETTLYLSINDFFRSVEYQYYLNDKWISAID
ncbi:hypothetical protein [Pseudoalteromonas denitrificans]|uniref:Two component regulator propeller n=1 Tax=Pseudoalteromonas denitrificans DSM 6059 TaxID=1123010 RepID=A0A1I1T7Y5_9GAMM|nr:hypothetical protein [Pseudoalteromonas denitrificans]SFD54744.1 hypothetical protein SAMN02745724_04812 [Pseudoalteromonas denitrificans DSM 6059]